jgi:hypothetical protein
MKRRTALLAALMCAVALSLSLLAALAIAAIAPRSLVAKPSQLPGFSAAKVRLRSGASPSAYAKSVLEERPRQARKEAARLKREGFREGVQELLSDSQGEALSLAIVFRTAKDAKRELKASISADVKAQGNVEVKQFSIASIPGAFAFTAAEAGKPGAAGNVLFSVGRCYLVVGDFLKTGTAEQASAVPMEGGPALYKRVKRLCG